MVLFNSYIIVLLYFTFSINYIILSSIVIIHLMNLVDISFSFSFAEISSA